LASVFEVSQPTLRKDLTVLEQQGLLKRTHGGALSIRAPGERDLMTRFAQNVEAEIVERFSIATAFIGASGITEEAITVADFNEAQLKAAIIKRTQRVIAPIDQSKIGVVDFTRVCEPRDIDIVVTDFANDHVKRICRDNEIKLVEASAKTSE
jgi:DeoR/GlpR family transcriptional regulator of sugar metabolism